MNDAALTDIFGDQSGAASTAPATRQTVADLPQLITTTGVFDITNDRYHADPVAKTSMTRGTVFDLIELTPAHAFHNHPRLGNDGEETAEDGEETAEDKFDLGTVWHAMTFEGEEIAAVIDPKDHVGPKGGIPKGWTNDSIRKARDEARAAGKIPMLPKQYKKVKAMVDAAHAFLASSEYKIKDLYSEGKAEQTYVWQEGETWFRVRPDWISHKNICGDRRLILDGKTVAQSADPNRFKPTEHGKDIQHSLYRRGVKAVDGGNAPRFLFLVQETFAPYLCSLIGLDPQTIQIAEQKIDFAKFMWEQCHALGEWPGYPTRACYVESKPWEVAAWEAKAATIGTGGE